MRRTLAIVLGAWLVVATPAATGAAPNAATLRLLSITAAGVKGDKTSYLASVSADGSVVAFQSVARNFDPRDTDRGYDIYVKDVRSGTLTLVSTTKAGVKGNSDSDAPSISGDGTKVAFESSARNFDPRDTDQYPDIYVRDLTTGSLTLVSTTAGGTKGNAGSFIPSISADGTTVAFYSDSSNFPGRYGGRQIWVKSLITGSLTLASGVVGVFAGNDESYDPMLSADGSKVAFWSYASNLSPSDPDHFADVYVRDLTSTSFTLVSTSSTGVKGNGDSRNPSISADGSRVSFYSVATNLDPADTDALRDIYVKEIGTGALTLGSVTAAGTKGDSDSLLPRLSSDGLRVAFQTYATNFDPRDTDAKVSDIYVKNLATGELDLLSTSASGIKGNQPSYGPAISEGGLTVAFHSDSSNLIAQDPDRITDVYAKTLS